MSDCPAVTVVCATRNARDAVRLTFASFDRHTPEPCVVVVADNGSSDGTLDDLRALPWLSVVSLPERRALMRAEAERAAAEARALTARLEAHAARLSPAARAAFEAARSSSVELPADEDATATLHGATLDWLAARVGTPFLLALDSDVEFLAAGWLTELLETMSARDLVALGEYCPGHGAYRPRLLPHLLLLRTGAYRALRGSFRSTVRIGDPDEARRWQSRPPSFNLDPCEFDQYQTGAFYATGAALFERIERAGLRWDVTPAAIARMYRHLGHMSWAGDGAGEVPGPNALANDHADRQRYARARLECYFPDAAT